MTFSLGSPAFGAGETMPDRHTCDGADISVPLKWRDPPAGTVTFALVVDDPDALTGSWLHWILWNLPARERSLPEGVPTEGTLVSGARQGINDYQEIGYRGPCPPPGPPHRYVFKLCAVDRELELAPGCSRPQFEGALEGHVLGEVHLIGKYQR